MRRLSLFSLLVVYAIDADAVDADVDETGAVNLLQHGLRASIPPSQSDFDPVVKLERETGLYCRFGGRLPWWRAYQAADRPKMALSCSEKTSICEELSQAAQKSCTGAFNLAEESCVMGIAMDVSVGLLENMGVDDMMNNPCRHVMEAIGDDFETMCWASETTCGAVMKVQEDPERGEAHCGATCKAAGMTCTASYNDKRRSCGRYWEETYERTCESNVGTRGVCVCAMPGQEDAPQKGDSFYFYGHKMLCEDFVTAGGGALLQTKTSSATSSAGSGTQ